MALNKKDLKVNYWQIKVPINIWAKSEEFNKLEENSIYPQELEDKKNMPRNNKGDIIFVHNTTAGTRKNYPDGLYFICEIISSIYYNDDEGFNCIDLQVIKNLKSNPLLLSDLGFNQLDIKINKLGVNGRIYLFKNEDYGEKLYNIILKKNQTIDSTTQDIKTICNEANIDTETQSIIMTRIGQGQFRDDLIDYWGGCSVTNCQLTEVLVASHIKPWKDSSDIERLDVYNGLLLLATLDKLFDRGYISFDNEGKIIISTLINDYNIIGINKNMSIDIETEHKKYLKFHRENIFISYI